MISSLLRGYHYNTPSLYKCRMFHPCEVSKKCQNYDPSVRQCFLCEQRVRPAHQLGGLLPDGKHVPDVQLAARLIKEFTKTAFASPDQKAQRFNPIEVSEKQKEYEWSKKVLRDFTLKNNGRHYVEETDKVIHI